MPERKRIVPLSVAVPGLGDRLRLAREHARASKADVARAVGVSPSAVSQWENEDCEPSVGNMIKFKRAYQASLDFIYAEDLSAVSPDFIKFIVDYGGRADAPELARRVRQQWGLPPAPATPVVSADEVAAVMFAAHPAPRKRWRPPRAGLHEDQAPQQD
jgi:transcriptional regulator with XRE-family HTH domain